MAKRVNVPFVFLLAIIVVVVCLLPLSVIGVAWLRNHALTPNHQDQIAEQYRLAQKLKSEQRNTEALAAITTAWGMDKKNKEVCLLRGEILMTMTDDEGGLAVEGARRAWEDALASDSHYKPALDKLLESYIDQMEVHPSAWASERLHDAAKRINKFDPADFRAREYLEISVIQQWVLGKSKTPDEIKKTFAAMRTLMAEKPADGDLLFYFVRGKVFDASDAYQSAHADVALADLNEARAVLDKVTAAYPKDAELNFRAFQGYVALFDTEQNAAPIHSAIPFDRAERQVADDTQTIEKPDSTVEQIGAALLDRGVNYGRIGQGDKEVADFTRVIEMNGASAAQVAKALVNRGTSFGRIGLTDKELADYARVIETKSSPDEQVADALLHRGSRYDQQGKSDKSIADNLRVLAMPGSTGEQKIRALAAKDMANAEAVLRRARENVKEDSDRYADFQNAASDWARRNERPDEAEKILRDFYDKHKTDQLARIGLCHLLAMTGDPAKRDEAIRILEQPILRNGQPSLRKVTLRELELLTMLDRTSLRVAAYSTVEPARQAALMAQIEGEFAKIQASTAADTIAVQRLKGSIAQLKGQNAEAVIVLSRALTLLKTSDPNNPIKFDLMHQLASAQCLAGQNRSAEKILAELVDRFEKYDPARLELAELYLEENDVLNASKHIKILEKRMPNSQQVLRMRINLARREDRTDDVEAMYKQLVENTFEEKLIKAQIAGTLKKHDETIRLLQGMAEMKPNQAAITIAIYQAYTKKTGPGDRDVARKYLEAALKKNPNDPHLQAVKRESEHPGPARPDRHWARLQALNGNKLFIAIEAGFEALERQNYAEAISRAREADAIRPDDPATWDLYFHIYKEQKNWELDNEAVKKLSDLDADHARGRMYRWTLAMTRGSYAEAIHVARDLTTDQGDFAQSWFLLAAALQANGEFQEAIQNYDAALARQSTNPDIFKGMAICYENLDKPDLANAKVLEGCRLFPDDPNLRELAINAEIRKDPVAVIPKRRKMLEQNPDDPDNYINLAGTLNRAFERRFPADPRQANGFMLDARDVLTKGAGRFPEDLRINWELASVLMASQNLEDGVKVLRALSQTPKWTGKPEPLLLLADYYLRSKQDDKAEQAYREAWATTKNLSVEIELRLANFYQTQQKFDEALNLLKANEADPRIVVRALQIHIAAKHTEQAMKGLNQALQKDPENPELLNLKAGVLIDALDFPQARTVLAHVLTIDPRNDLALFLQALTELRDPISSDLDLAKTNLGAVVTRNPRHMQFRLKYVDALIRTNDLDLATVELDNALRMDLLNTDLRIKLLDLDTTLKKWAQFEQVIQFAENNPRLNGSAIWPRLHAYAFAAQERFDDAKDRIRVAVSMAPDNPAFERDYLIIMMMSKDYDGINRETDRLINLGHHEWWVYHLRGLGRIGAGNQAQAMEEFTKAMGEADKLPKPQPGDSAWQQVLESVAQINLDEAIRRVTPRIGLSNHWRLESVYLHMRKRDWAEATTELEVMLPTRQSLSRDERLSAVRVAAECYQAAGDSAKAEIYFGEWIKEAPNDTAALNNFACLLAENPRRLEDARKFSQRAYELTTKYNNADPLIADTHGWILSRLTGTYASDGLEILKSLVAAHDDMVDAHYHLGMAYRSRGRNAESLAQLNAALRVIKAKEEKQIPVNPTMKARVLEALDKAKVNAGK